MTTSRKLTNVLQLITGNLTERKIPHALMGALALGIYGLPRFTADIDLLTEGRYWNLISPVMENLGYTCFQKTKSFAQFDSEMGVLGKVDFMFINTTEGKNILERSVFFEDDFLGGHRVIQPTDYIVLKLMAIANNPDRSLKDEADIVDLLRLSKSKLIPANFDSPDRDRIYYFAEKFEQRQRIEAIFMKIDKNQTQTEGFIL